jgi:2-polyprenyl-6-methoxyphenol hydroxylase-like FAD-dependent oxidoreductase
MIDTDVVIGGAGVGGSLLTLLLGQQGHRVMLVEPEPGVSSRGADFIKPRGIRILTGQGLLADLLARGAVRGDTIDFFHDGAPLNTYRFADHTALGHFLILPYRETVSAILARCSVLPNVDIRFSRQVETIDASESTVTALTLTDGTEVRARVVVHAGGPNSPLYSFVEPSREVQTYDHAVRMASVELRPSIAERNRMYFSSDGCFTYVYPLDATTARVFVGLPTEQDAAVFDHKEIDLIARLRPFVTESYDALYHLDASQFLKTPVQSLRSNPYHRGNVVLLGGTTFACHPMTGQGMSYTMEDAVVLAEILNDSLISTADLEQQLDQRYESRRRAHIRLIEYGDGLARSYSDPARYMQSFQADLHGGDL